MQAGAADVEKVLQFNFFCDFNIKGPFRKKRAFAFSKEQTLLL